MAPSDSEKPNPRRCSRTCSGTQYSSDPSNPIRPPVKSLRPVFILELRPTGGSSFGDRLFLMGASRLCQLTWDIGKSTSSLVCISLSQDLPHCPRWGFVALAESYALFSQDLPWCGNPTIAKTKISAFLQLFCDCGCRCSRIIHGSSFPLRESFSRGGELVTTVILGSACFPLGFVDSRNSLLNQRPREGNGAYL